MELGALLLNLTIYLPLAIGLLLLILPVRCVRWGSLVATGATLGITCVLWAGNQLALPSLRAVTTLSWIPELGARYDLSADGLSLSLMTLAALLSGLSLLYAAPASKRPRAHAFLFLLMETGLLGLFSARDLLLFYLFWEVALVPLYFIIGIWGGERRGYAALKFFLYTRVGSLAMLLSFLALYLGMRPHTFSLQAIASVQPLSGTAATLAFVGMLLGFGVKLPSVPLHNWLPDAHVEAPTEGSVMLAGILLKMGGFGFIRILLPTLTLTVRTYAWMLVALAIASILYGSLLALAQTDIKRLVAYTSINHMGFVLLGVGIAALTDDPTVRELALTGASVQMVSHGLLTGGMFFLVGTLRHEAHTGEIARFGGLIGRAPVFSFLLAVLAFGSLGLPGLSGFVAELQVLAASLPVGGWIAGLALLGILLTTGLYVRLQKQLLMGEAPEAMPPVRDLSLRQTLAVAPLALLAFVVGIVPGPLVGMITGALRFLVRGL